MVAILFTGALAACNSSQTPPPAAELLDVEGLWQITASSGNFYMVPGLTTVEFGAAAAGRATYLSRSDTTKILTCEQQQYATLAENVLLLDGIFYEAIVSGPNEIELVNDLTSVTLTRVTGAPPVEPCLELEGELLKTIAYEPSSATTLAAVGSKLYFTIDQTGYPIVGYDTASDTLGAPRTYAGNHDHLIAARSDIEFYGNCACGYLYTLERFDIDLPAPLASIQTSTDFGLDVSVRSGSFDGTSVIVAGSDRTDDDINYVMILDPDTLALQDQYQVLPGAHIDDLAWTGSKLAALIDHRIVYLGSDGLAETTMVLPESFPWNPSGLAVSGGYFHILGIDGENQAVIYRAAVP